MSVILRAPMLPAAVVAWLVLAAIPAEAWAADLAVRVWAIRATKANDKISPELKPLAEKLKKQFKYTGYRLVKKAGGRSAIGKPFTAELFAGYKAKVTPLKHDGKRVRLKIEVSRKVGKQEKRRGQATVTIDSGRFHLWGGWRIDNQSDDVLILAVSAR